MCYFSTPIETEISAKYNNSLSSEGLASKEPTRKEEEEEEKGRWEGKRENGQEEEREKRREREKQDPFCWSGLGSGLSGGPAS